MKYFDFHCHVDTKELDENRAEILQSMAREEIGCCTIGVNQERSLEAVALANSHPCVWACVGQHPLDTYAEVFDWDFYQGLIDTNPRVLGVGECGLDYYWLSKDLEAGKINKTDVEQEKNRQRKLFRSQIDLAVANDVPLMLHIRSAEGTQDAYLEALEILEKKNRPQAVFHFYTEGSELAQKIVDAGYYISLPGVITFGNKVAHLEEAVRVVPRERIFAETDTPYAAPVPHRGTVNNPLYVSHVYDKIAELRGEDLEMVRAQIMHNVQSFFNIEL